MNRIASGKPLVVALVVLVHFTFAFVLMIPQVLIPFWKEDYGIGDSLSSLLGAMFFVAYGVSSIPLGWLVGRTGLKRFTLIAGLILLVGCALFAANTGLQIGFVAFLIVGVGVTALQIAGSLLVKGLNDSPASYSRNYSLTLVIIGLGGLSGGVTIGVLSDRLHLPWYSLFYLFGALALLLIGLTLLLKTEPAPGTPETATGSGRGLLALLSRPGFLVYVLAIFLYLGVEIGIASRIASLLVEKLAIEKSQAALAVSLYWLAQTLGRLSGGWILKRFDQYKVLALYAIGCAAALGFAVLSPTGALAILGFALAGFFTSIMFPVLYSSGLQQVDKSQEGLAAGVLCTAIIGGAAIPVLIALLGQTMGTPAIAMLAVLGLSLLYIFALGYRNRGAAMPASAPALSVADERPSALS